MLGVAGSPWLYPRRLADAGVRFIAFALFMGAAMSITAFPVLARILTERKLLRTRVGAIAIACAAVDDVTAWCMLAFVVGVARASGLAQRRLAPRCCAVAYIVVMVLRRCGRWSRALAARVASREPAHARTWSRVVLLLRPRCRAGPPS